MKRVHAGSAVIGFKGGPKGIFSGKWVDIGSALVGKYRNMGGFDMIGSGRDKIETDEQFVASARVCTELALDGLVIIGGDDSNTNACLLAGASGRARARTARRWSWVMGMRSCVRACVAQSTSLRTASRRR